MSSLVFAVPSWLTRARHNGPEAAHGDLQVDAAFAESHRKVEEILATLTLACQKTGNPVAAAQPERHKALVAPSLLLTWILLLMLLKFSLPSLCFPRAVKAHHM
jgi:hypothetical protein